MRPARSTDRPDDLWFVFATAAPFTPGTLDDPDHGHALLGPFSGPEFARKVAGAFRHSDRNTTPMLVVVLLAHGLEKFLDSAPMHRDRKALGMDQPRAHRGEPSHPDTSSTRSHA